LVFAESAFFIERSGQSLSSAFLHHGSLRYAHANGHRDGRDKTTATGGTWAEKNHQMRAMGCTHGPAPDVYAR
jgi:hypothetical protein